MMIDCFYIMVSKKYVGGQILKGLRSFFFFFLFPLPSYFCTWFVDYVIRNFIHLFLFLRVLKSSYAHHN